MSVPNQTPYIIYNANGLTTVFPFEFYIINSGDIQVSINGTIVTSGYSVSGVGNVGGGDVTFITPPASGSVVMLERVVPTYRLTDYQDNGDLLADTVNKDFDRLWMAIQRSFIYLGLALRRPLLGGPFNAEGYRIAGLANPVDAQDAATKNYVDNVSLVRALRVPESSVGILPPADQRANKLLAFNALGQPITVVPQSGSASDVLIELAKPTGASLIGVQPQGSLAGMQYYVTPEQFGAVGDGIIDDTLAFRAALSHASTGDIRWVRGGLGSTYKVSQLEIPVGVKKITNASLLLTASQGVGIYSLATSGHEDLEISDCQINGNGVARGAILLNGAVRCRIVRNRVYGFTADGTERYGIRIGTTDTSSVNLYNTIEENNITMPSDPDRGAGIVGIAGIYLVAPVNVDSNGAVLWSSTYKTIQYTQVNNNICTGGTHNIQAFGLFNAQITENTLIGGSHRNINLGSGCERIHISDNRLINAESAAIIFGESRYVQISTNYIQSAATSIYSSDDSAIQFAQGANNIDIFSNTILGDWKYGVHCFNSRYVNIKDNSITASKAGIAIESSQSLTLPSDVTCPHD
ncbi:phage tail fiber protein [Enterobacter kobei]|uniref:phage tail fiber domain-containing protein n=1 Tax=Enterobacter kobei TaxID=208224 RepID=UPI0039B583E7